MDYELRRWERFRIQGSKFIIPVVSLGIFLAALDQTVVVTALWPISTDLQIPVTELDRAAWVVTAYLLGYTVALPLMGRVADVYGQRRIYMVSLGLFMFGSLVCALAPSLPWLIGARALQAVGGGAILPVGMAMSRHLSEEKRLPFVLGMLGAVAEAGGVIGPLWGALILKNFDGIFGMAGWRWIFWVNIPLGLLFGLLVLLVGPVNSPAPGGKVDWAGAGLLGGGLLCLSLALSTPGSVGAWVGLSSARDGRPADLVTPQGVALLVAAMVFFGAFVAWQRRSRDPLVPRDLFRGAAAGARERFMGFSPFAAALLTNTLVGAALIITMVNVPLYVASVADGTTEQGGLMLLRMTVFIPVGAVLGGLLGVRVAYRWTAIAGLVAAAAGFWAMHAWTTGSADYPSTWLGLAINGFGFGLLLSPVTATALSWGGLPRAALSAASVNLARVAGMIVCLSLITALGLRRFQTLMLSHPAVIFANPGESAQAFAARQAEYTNFYKSASLEVYQLEFLVAGGICLLAIVFALHLRRNPDDKTEPGVIF
jgi:MFS family permease